jgi:diguanylate cyclase (GGDEF)-like protein/PAS domain S-box-containing protein
MSIPLSDAPNELAELYALHGLAFFALFVAVFLRPRSVRTLPFMVDLWLLGGFALLQGLREFAEAWLLLYPQADGKMLWVEAGMLLVAYLALFEFGRRMIRRSHASQVPQPIVGPFTLGLYALIGGAILAFGGVSERFPSGIEAGARYFLGLPGALMAGWVCWSRAADPDWAVSLLAARALRAAGITWVIYGLAAGLFVRPDSGLPAWLPTRGDFQRLFGVSVQDLRMACALVLSPALIVLEREAYAAAHRRDAEADEKTHRVQENLMLRLRQSHAELEQANHHLLAEVKERRKVEETLRKRQRLLDNIANSSPALIRVCGMDRARCEFNQTWLGFTGITAEQAAGQGWLEAVHPDDVPAYLKVHDGVYESRQPFSIEYRLRRYDGAYRWMLEQGKPTFDGDGQFAGYIGSSLDITDRKQSEARFQETLSQLRVSEQRQRELNAAAQRDQGRLRSLLSAMNIGILFEDRNHIVEYVNPAFLRTWALDEDFAPVGSHTREIALRSRRRLVSPQAGAEMVLRVHYPLERSELLEMRFDDGTILTQSSYPVSDAQGHLMGRLWLYEDITQERETAEQLRYMAERDPLTGLSNRHHFNLELRALIASSLRNGGRFALVYFDLDEFKFINDTFGHKAGDTVLSRIAAEVAVLLRSGDNFARLGGDEFAVLSVLGPDDDPTVLARRLLNTLRGVAFRFSDTTLRITGSVGIAIYAEHGSDAEDLVAHADTAMYQAKARGRNAFSIFDPKSEVVEAMAERLSWNRRISDALRHEFFELHLQGVYAVEGNRLHHLEALLRMRDPSGNGPLIHPSRFLGAAEQSGQIGHIDRWVLGKAIGYLSRDPELPPLAVNISGRSLNDHLLPQFIRIRLAEYNVEPSRLILEMGEAAAVADIPAAQRFIEAIQHIGCGTSLEDFGTGLASFACLRSIGAGILKIDGKLIRELAEQPANTILLKAIVETAAGLGKTLVAESVEDAATLELIRGLGVPLAQGFHLGHPKPGDLYGSGVAGETTAHS